MRTCSDSNVNQTHTCKPTFWRLEKPLYGWRVVFLCICVCIEPARSSLGSLLLELCWTHSARSCNSRCFIEHKCARHTTHTTSIPHTMRWVASSPEHILSARHFDSVHSSAGRSNNKKAIHPGRAREGGEQRDVVAHSIYSWLTWSHAFSYTNKLNENIRHATLGRHSESIFHESTP